MIEANFITAPLSMTEAVSKSFRLWWKNLYGVIIFSLLSGLISVLPHILGLDMGSPTDSKTIPIITLVIISVINLLISAVIYAKFIHAIHGQIINNSQALGLSLTKIPTLLLLSILYMVIFIGPIILWVALIHQITGKAVAILSILFVLIFLIFATILLIYSILAMPIIMSEKINAIAAFKRSIFLVHGGWWYTSVVVSILFLVAIAGETLFTMLLGKQIGIVLGQMLFMPLSAAFMTVLYEHHKQRLSLSAGNVVTIKPEK